MIRGPDAPRPQHPANGQARMHSNFMPAPPEEPPAAGSPLHGARDRTSTREHVVDLARRTGALGLEPDVVLAEESPWRQRTASLARVRTAAARRGRERLVGRHEVDVARTEPLLRAAEGRIERAAGDVDAAELARAELAAEAASARDAERALPGFRRGVRTDLLEILVAAVAFIGADTVVLHLSQAAMPASPAE